jgi:hypothetical protein
MPESNLGVRPYDQQKSRQSRMAQPETPYFDRDEVIAYMVIAFCIGNFTLGTIHRLFG